MSWAEPGEGQPWLSREEIVAREVEAAQREARELHERMLKRCHEAEARWRAAHPNS